MAGFEEVDAAQLTRTLEAANGTTFVLVDFFSPRNCESCIAQGALEKIENEYAGWYLLRLDVDAYDSPPVLEDYKIIGIPTLMLFKPSRLRSKFVEVPDSDGENVLKWLESESGVLRRSRRSALQEEPE